MKYLLAIFMISIQTLCIGQWERLKGHWICNDGKSIYIDNPESLYNVLSNANLFDANFELKIYGDTLSFFSKFISSSTIIDEGEINRIDLLIISYNDSFILVKPVSNYSKEYLKTEEIIKYTRLKYLVDTTIHLERIIYHTTECMGLCPRIDLEIDQDKKLYMNAKFYPTERFSIDSLSSGEFYGTVPDSLYNKLVKIIQSCPLRTIKMGSIYIEDLGKISLIIYFNGEKRIFRSSIPPMVLHDLILFLYSIHERIPLIKTNVIREFEK